MSADVEDFESPLTATFKAGTGYDAPWIAVRAKDATELTARLVDLQTNDSWNLVRRYALEFQGKKSEAAPSAPSTRAESPSRVENASAPQSPPSSASGAASDPITVAINSAESVAALGALYKQFKAQWTEGHTKLAAAKRAALEGKA